MMRTGGQQYDHCVLRTFAWSNSLIKSSSVLVVTDSSAAVIGFPSFEAIACSQRFSIAIRMQMFWRGYGWEALR